MSFSARGYAILNEKLAPDIAVLEGGYSIETALPYVNLGIIMAMAGLDYSNLYEPDYRQNRFKENRNRMQQLEKIVQQQYHLFQRRHQLTAQGRPTGEPFTSGSVISITTLIKSANSN